MYSTTTGVDILPTRLRLGRGSLFFLGLLLLWPVVAHAQVGLSTEELPVQLTRPDASLKFRALDVSTGMPDDFAAAMIQDSRGFIWTGGFTGIVRYDGYDMKVYRPDPEDPHSIPGGTAASLVETGDGYIWVGVLDPPAAARFDPVTEEFQSFIFDSTDVSSLSAGPVFATFEDSRGDLWIGTAGSDDGEGGLNRFNPADGTFQRFQHDPDDPNSISESSVVSIAEDLAGNLWIGTQGGGLNRFNRDTGDFVAYRHDPDDQTSLSHDDVWTINVDSKGTIRVGVGDAFGRDPLGGLNEFQPATGTFKRYINDPRDPTSITGTTVHAIHEDPSGSLWVGTVGALNFFDPSTGNFTQIGENATVLSLMEDRSGVLWNGTWDKGARALDRLANRFVHYGHEPGNPNSIAIGDVMAVREVPAGSDVLWIGTWGGGLTRLNRTTGQIKRYSHDPDDPRSLSHPLARSIYETRDGSMWVGTWGGLNRYDPRTDDFDHWVPDPDDSTSISHQSVRVMLEDRAGNFWLGTWGGGLNRFDRGTGRFDHWLLDPNTDNLGNNQVGVIFEDLAGRLWVSNNNGVLFRFDREKEEFVERFFDEDSAGVGAGNDILDGSGGHLWLGTYQGVIDFDPSTGAYTQYTDKDGLGHIQIKGLMRDRAGRLWAVTNNGVSRFDASSRTWRNYNSADGLSQSKFEARAFYASPTGEFYMGGAEGVEAFFPDQIQDDPRAPKVAITELRLFGRPLAPGDDSPLEQNIVETESITLSYDQNELGFSFAGLHFVRPEQNQYMYKLEPYDKDWSEPSTQRTAHYTNLDPGDYVLSVRASNNDGVWSEETASLRIKITPPFWATWWFRFLGLAAFAGVIAAGFKMRTRQLAERSRQLESLVTKRTEELAVRNTQLEQSHTIVEAINKETSFRRLLTKILEEARVIPGVEKATAIVYMPEEGAFRVRASSGWDVASMEHIRLTPAQATARYVDRSTELAPDIFLAKNVRDLAGADQMKEFGDVASFLVLRVNVEGQVAGYLVFDNLTDSDAFDDKDVALLERLKEHIQSAFIKTRLLEGLRNQNDQISAQRAELQRTLDSLRTTQDRLVQSEKMASLGQLTAGIAHEIKNPLNFVNNFSEMSAELTDELVEEVMARKDSLPEDFVRELEGILQGLKINAQKISEHGKRADSIVQNMLQHSRGGEGERQKVDLNELLEEYVNLAFHGIRARESDFNATIHREYDENLGSVEVIPQDIGRVFLNLLGNAFDALRMDGAARGQNGPTVTVSTSNSGGRAEIRIADNGPGIPDHVKSRIFEPFFTTKPTGSGTGLGLSMSYDIVTKGHGGELDVESEPGKGATFIVRLPV